MIWMILTEEKREEFYYYRKNYFGAVIQNGRVRSVMNVNKYTCKSWEQHLEFTHYILPDFLKTLPFEQTRKDKIKNIINDADNDI